MIKDDSPEEKRKWARFQEAMSSDGMLTGWGGEAIKYILFGRSPLDNIAGMLERQPPNILEDLLKKYSQRGGLLDKNGLDIQELSRLKEVEALNNKLVQKSGKGSVQPAVLQTAEKKDEVDDSKRPRKNK